jgi:hypothetical protein
MISTFKFNFLLIVSVFFSTFTFASTPSNVPTIVYSILSYAKWQKTNPTVCIVNNQELTNKFNNTPTTSTNNYKITNIAATELRNTACNAIVFSTLSPKEEQYLLNNVINFPALTISTNNSQCEEGSAFCLYKRNQQLSFKVNLESVSQSRVHIDPRVLLLAKHGE